MQRGLVQDLAEEVSCLKSQLRAARKKEGVHLPLEEFERLSVLSAVADGEAERRRQLVASLEHERQLLAQANNKIEEQEVALRLRQEEVVTLYRQVEAAQDRANSCAADLVHANTQKKDGLAALAGLDTTISRDMQALQTALAQSQMDQENENRDLLSHLQVLTEEQEATMEMVHKLCEQQKHTTHGLGSVLRRFAESQGKSKSQQASLSTFATAIQSTASALTQKGSEVRVHFDASL